MWAWSWALSVPSGALLPDWHQLLEMCAVSTLIGDADGID